VEEVSHCPNCPFSLLYSLLSLTTLSTWLPSSIYSNISIRMRPPTRSTRSTRLPSNKPTTNARGSRTSDPLTRNPAPSQPNASATPTTTIQPKQPQFTAATVDTTNVDAATSPSCSDPSSTPPVVGYCSVSSTPPTKFVFENQKLELEYHQSQVHAQAQTSPAGSSHALGKPPRSRHRMTSEKLETLDAFFRRNTHPSRKEKEAICKNLDM
jgi:Homeodomain